jgi:hypothetical protein
MDLIPKPVFLSNTPETVIESIMYRIRFFDEYERVEFPEEREKVDNLILLGTSEQMESVWNTIRKLECQHPHGNFNKACNDFTSAISSALYMESPWAAIKPTTRETTHEGIIRTMRYLARDIKNYDLDQREKVVHASAPSTSFKDLYINQTGIQISDLLLKHADKLEQQKRHHAPLTRKTTGERALLHFIRTLGIYNIGRYGELKGAMISHIAQVFFEDQNLDLEPEKIRASFKALKMQPITKIHK